jgi:CRP/FNR family transcriptional regulator
MKTAHRRRRRDRHRQTESWIDRFKGLSRLEPTARCADGRSQVVRMPEGTVIFGPGKSPENMLLLLEGTVRVQQLAENGREVVLYRVTAGESCVMTTACMLAYEDYSAEGIAETDVVAAAVPRAVFDELVATSKDFRTFVFTAYSRRMTDLFHVIEDIAFRRMDIRLAQKIAERAEDGTVRATHAQLAAELGTAREVISRSWRSSSAGAGWTWAAARSRFSTPTRWSNSPRAERAFCVAENGKTRVFRMQNCSFAARKLQFFCLKNREILRFLAAGGLV